MQFTKIMIHRREPVLDRGIQHLEIARIENDRRRIDMREANLRRCREHGSGLCDRSLEVGQQVEELPLARAREVRHQRLDPAMMRGRHLVEQVPRSEEHTSELQSLMRISYAVFCLKKKTTPATRHSKISLNK